MFNRPMNMQGRHEGVYDHDRLVCKRFRLVRRRFSENKFGSDFLGKTTFIAEVETFSAWVSIMYSVFLS
jgi:hypothetical protein